MAISEVVLNVKYALSETRPITLILLLVMHGSLISVDNSGSIKNITPVTSNSLDELNNNNTDMNFVVPHVYCHPYITTIILKFVHSVQTQP